MAKPLRFGTAVSAIALASMVAACAAPQQATNFGGELDKNVGLATRALAALQANQLPQAIEYAERAVEGTPNDAGYRALLGNAYFAAGRFWSAEAAYKDSLSIYSNQPKVVLKLALVETALGKNDEAISFLEAGRGVLDPSDYGLAIALAGRAHDAIAVLEPAARQRGADAQVRQNLALAYALSGNWQQARTIASQDVPANQLDTRIQQWMQLASPKRPSDQVAALVGVKPAGSDSGQPIRLALRKPDTMMAQAKPMPAPAPVNVQAAPVVQVARATLSTPAVEQAAPAPAFAEATVVPAITPVAEPPRPIRAVAPAPQAPRPAPAVVAEAETVPVTLAMIAAAAPEAASAFVAAMPKKKKAAAPAARPAKIVHKAMAAAKRQLRAGDSVVQLGAYSSPTNATAAWGRLTQRYPALKAYLPVRARFVSAKGTFWRLSIQGFASEREAIARCQLLKSRGGSCFVRDFAGDKPVSVAAS